MIHSMDVSLKHNSNSVEISCSSFLMSNVSSWEFDPLQASMQTPDFLAFMFYNMVVENNDQVEKLNNLMPFSIAIARLYHDAPNPYHNKRHAAHVLNNFHMLLKATGELQNEPYLRLAAYIAVYCHDVDHYGTTNGYLIATKHVRAMRYNCTSPQEMHHASIACELVDRFKLLKFLNVDHVEFKKNIVRFIIYTDISKHDKFCKSFDPSSQRHRIKLLVKCSDLGHTHAPLSQHVKWVQLLQSEFFIQGDKEKVQEIPITPLMDRSSPKNMAAIQPKFFKFVIMPMIDLLYVTFPIANFNKMKENINANLEYWQGKCLKARAQKNQCAQKHDLYRFIKCNHLYEIKRAIFTRLIGLSLQD